MSYDERKKVHARCKEQMSAMQWKKFVVKGTIRCPICGGY